MATWSCWGYLLQELASCTEHAPSSGGSRPPQPPQHLWLFVSSAVALLSAVVSTSISLVSHNPACLLMSLLAICVCSLEKCLLRSCAHSQAGL